jgi:hypothetical protein
MPTVTCPNADCRNRIIGIADNFQDTIQCDKCASVVRVVTRQGKAVDVRLRKIDLDIPAGLPPELEMILSEAIACFEIGSNAATVVLSGLFMEGLLFTVGMNGNRLVDMIEQAHKDKLISTLGFHVATASRLLRNIGAHYSKELTQLNSSDARLVLEMTRKLAADIVMSGKLKSTTGN